MVGHRCFASVSKERFECIRFVSVVAGQWSSSWFGPVDLPIYYYNTIYVMVLT